MPERDFEKKVQQVMEPFQLAPDARLFPAILDQVRQRRKRRRRLFWLWLPVLLLPATCYWMYQSGGSKDPQVQPSPAAAVTMQSAVPGVIAHAGEQTKKTAIADPSAADENQPAEQHTILPAAPSAGTAGVPTSVLHARQTTVRKRNARTRIRTVMPGQETAQMEEENAQRTSEITASESKTAPVEKEVTAKASASLPEQIPPVTVQKQAAERKKDTSISVKKEVAVNKQKRKLSWMISLGAGISGMGNSYTNSDLYNSEALTGPGNSPGPSQITYSPAAVRKGPGFMAGIGLQWPVSEKLRIRTGLEYRYLSTSLPVGDLIRSGQLQGSAQSDQFQSGSSRQYRNVAQLISLPVSLHLEAFRIGGYPVELGVGLQLDRVIHQKLLQFNPYSGTYFEDGQGMRRLLAGFQLSAAINLAGKNKPAVYLGPEFRQTFTSAAEGGLYARARYQYFGLRISRQLRQ